MTKGTDIGCIYCDWEGTISGLKMGCCPHCNSFDGIYRINVKSLKKEPLWK